MKTTIAISQNCRIEVNPCSLPGQRDHVVMQIMERTQGGNFSILTVWPWELVRAFLLKPDEVGALIFALESAAEAAQIAQDRAAA